MGPEVVVGFAQVAEPVSRKSMLAPIEAQSIGETETHTTKCVTGEREETAMEVTEFPVLEVAKSQCTLGVHLDVVGSDVVVTVDTKLLASP